MIRDRLSGLSVKIGHKTVEMLLVLRGDLLAFSL